MHQWCDRTGEGAGWRSPVVCSVFLGPNTRFAMQRHQAFISDGCRVLMSQAQVPYAGGVQEVCR